MSDELFELISELCELPAPSGREAAEVGVHVGSSVVFATVTRRLGRRIVGKAMDDRVPLAVLDLVLDGLDLESASNELWIAASVQEESGLHGARAIAARTSFD